MPTLSPLCKPYHQRRPNASDRLRIPGSTLDSDWTDYLNLTAWFSYYVVSFRLHTCSTDLPRRTTIHLFTNHNGTAWQSTQDHQEGTQNPCQQSLYNPPLYPIFQNVHWWTFSSRLSQTPLNTSHKAKKLQEEQKVKCKLRRWPFHYVRLAQPNYYLNISYYSLRGWQSRHAGIKVKYRCISHFPLT